MTANSDKLGAMRSSVFALVATLSLAAAALAQPAAPFLGRWDLTVTPPGDAAYPQWMELVEKDGKLDGRIQPRGGAVRPIVAAKLDGSRLIVTTTAATDRSPEITWDLTVSGSRLTGTQKQGDHADTTHRRRARARP